MKHLLPAVCLMILCLSTHGQVKGLLVLNARQLKDSISSYAARQGLIVTCVVPFDDAFENFTSTKLLDSIDAQIGEMIKAYQVPPNKVIIGGMSVAGTGAIRYAEYCQAGHSAHHIQPAGVFAVDPPLDYERVVHEAQKAIERNYSRDAVEESQLLIKYFGNTDVKKSSPFCYTEKNGGNAYLLNNLAVRLYVDPDINWWIDNRRKDYYDLNLIDLAALVNQLKLNGNNKAELVIAHSKGENVSDRHPHNWNMVDQQELVDWCLRILQ